MKTFSMQNILLSLLAASYFLTTCATTNGASQGRASWYGKKYHGHKTASGQIYNMYGFTAAHRLYRFGTMLKVTNLTNGKFVIVRVNDRGPFKTDRIIDLSYAAAKKIGMISKGVVKVKIDVINKN